MCPVDTQAVWHAKHRHLIGCGSQSLPRQFRNSFFTSHSTDYTQKVCLTISPDNKSEIVYVVQYKSHVRSRTYKFRQNVTEWAT